MKFQRLTSQPDAIVWQLGSVNPSTRLATFWQGVFRSSTAVLAFFWSYGLKALTGSREPVVRRQAGEGGDRYTSPVYSIYDPVTQTYVAGLSEAEVRTWLEQRYYNHTKTSSF